MYRLLDCRQKAEVLEALEDSAEPWIQELYCVAAQWIQGDDTISFKTSGSTGAPKTLVFTRQQIKLSALRTADSFDLQGNILALHCLPSQYVAGKMMLLRALILGWRLILVRPKMKLKLQIKDPIDFAAMIPTQVMHWLDDSDRSPIRRLIIGGARVSTQLTEKLQTVTELQAWETYGMTETLTHVAARRLSPKCDVSFYPLSDIELSIDDEKRLIVNDEITGAHCTNDIVDLHSDQGFDIKGRADFVINSGGLKIFPQDLEAKLSGLYSHDILITSEPDKNLGERIILLVDMDEKMHPYETHFAERLEKKLYPRRVYRCQIPRTPTGKINRLQSQLVEKHLVYSTV